mmetsp:Transcript_5607/g.23770  ORF Transcript_5607/g.23770 Transcript_5607/m.23770 type:complete len:242 (-) Transcript_5607:337-1062(-)
MSRTEGPRRGPGAPPRPRTLPTRPPSAVGWNRLPPSRPHPPRWRAGPLCPGRRRLAPRPRAPRPVREGLSHQSPGGPPSPRGRSPRLRKAAQPREGRRSARLCRAAPSAAGCRPPTPRREAPRLQGIALEVADAGRTLKTSRSRARAFRAPGARAPTRRARALPRHRPSDPARPQRTRTWQQPRPPCQWQKWPRWRHWRGMDARDRQGQLALPRRCWRRPGQRFPANPWPLRGGRARPPRR